MAQFILSKRKLLEQYKMLDGLGIVSYSFKTNVVVGQVLEDLTLCDFSVHFINELKLIKNRSRVWFLSQALNEDAVEKIFSMGVRRFVVENEHDLNVLLEYCSKSSQKIDLMLRIKLKENTIRTERHYVFGLESERVNALLPELKENPFVSKLGVHFHRKTQNVSEWNLISEFSEIISEDAMKSIDLVDIGGGLPVMYKNTSDKALPGVIAKIAEFAKWLSQKNIQMIVEPGRFLCAAPIKFETAVVGVHDNTIVIDASVYNSSPDTLIVPIKLLVEGECEPHEGKPYVIKGITPCSTDLFRYRVYLKQSPKVGERIVFLNAGAYNFHTHFCELDKIETLIVD